jgi:spore maturation protein CgeB
MKILLYGENWEGTHVDTVSKILTEKQIPHKIFDFYRLLSYKTGNTFANRVLRRLFYSKNETVINKLLLKEIDIFKPDVLLISKGVNIYPETLIAFKNRSIIVVNWNQDDFFNKYNSSKHLMASLPIYDCVFSPRQHLFEAYHKAGIKKLVFLESYYVPWLHKKPAKIEQQQRIISFAGSYSKRRETIIGAIDAAYPIEIWGSGWGLSTLRTRKNIDIKNKVLAQADFPEIISRSLINLNILTIENNDLTNLKVFEITACYGLLLTDYNAYTESILKNGAYYYTPLQGNELNERIAFIFNPENAGIISQVKETGYLTTTGSHNTINDRVDRVLEVINHL